jgi:uncharacterized protein
VVRAARETTAAQSVTTTVAEGARRLDAEELRVERAELLHALPPTREPQVGSVAGRMLVTGPPTATPEPSRKLAPAARRLWRIEGVFSAAFALAAAGVLQAVAGGTLALLGWLAAVAIGAVTTFAVPELRWRRWRWEVREHEIDIRRGTVAVTRTLVPMLRVQHVDTRRDLLQQWLGLATVVFHTAAGANEIPALTLAEAAHVRDRIAELARTADEL